MSEYQYYGFQTVDRSLTDKEISELRCFSTRADITANSFINEYSWGSFKGIELLVDLHDLAARGDPQEFLLKLDALKQRHSSKSSFVDRLRTLALSWGSTAHA